MVQYKQLEILRKTCHEILREGLKEDRIYSLSELIRQRNEMTAADKKAYEPCERCPLRKY